MTLARPSERTLFTVSLAAALAPVLLAMVRAVERGWLPVGDNGYFALRARDVFTEHHPLLGTWTSASVGTGSNFNNPGPLLFDLLALPAKLYGGSGVAIGAALINAAAIVGIAVFARRRGGAMTAAAAMAVTALLSWSMGSELLFDPWQPHNLLLPFLLVLVLVWSVAAGDLVALPWAVGVASVVVQTHLSYVVLLAALAVWGTIGLVLALRGERTADPERWPGRRRAVGRTLAVAAAMLALCWAQPLVEQLTSDGQGNLSRLAGNATNAGGDAERAGYDVGTRAVAAVLAFPPAWFRPSLSDSLLPPDDPGAPAGEVRLPDLPSLPLSLAALVVLAGALAVAGWRARRRGDRSAVLAAGTAGVALVAGLVTAASLPIGVLGLAPHQFRWLWPVGAFVLLAVALGAATGRRRDHTGLVFAGVTVAVALANLPAWNAEAGPAGDAASMPIVERLHDEMAVLDGAGPVLVDLRGIRFAEPYSGAVFAELQRRGIDFVVDDPVDIRQVGDSRRYDGRNAEVVLVIREGDGVLSPPPGTEPAAVVEGLTDREQRRLAAAKDEIADLLEGPLGVPLNERGERALRAGRLPVLEKQVDDGEIDAEQLLRWREVDLLVNEDLLDLPAEHEPLFRRYADLQRRWDRLTVGLFIGPVPDDLPPETQDSGSS